MITISAEPLLPDTFAPFGHVAAGPAIGKRTYLDAALQNQRPIAARPSLSVAHIAPRAERPLALAVIERHEFSSQTFVPLDAGRYLVVVAPKESAGLPQLEKTRAFVATADQSLTYSANVWHGPMTPLDGPMRFAIFMFNDGVSGDEEFLRYDSPFATVVLG